MEDGYLSVFRPDMIILGFQEIVPLTAQQIVQTDPEKRCVPQRLVHKHNLLRRRRLWERKVMDNIERRPEGESRYVLLRSEQV
jgi:hypothetical protein